MNLEGEAVRIFNGNERLRLLDEDFERSKDDQIAVFSRTFAFDIGIFQPEGENSQTSDLLGNIASLGPKCGQISRFNVRYIIARQKERRQPRIEDGVSGGASTILLTPYSTRCARVVPKRQTRTFGIGSSN